MFICWHLFVYLQAFVRPRLDGSEPRTPLKYTRTDSQPVPLVHIRRETMIINLVWYFNWLLSTLTEVQRKKKWKSLSYRFVGRQEIPLLKEHVWFWIEDIKTFFQLESGDLGMKWLEEYLLSDSSFHGGAWGYKIPLWRKNWRIFPEE